MYNLDLQLPRDHVASVSLRKPYAGLASPTCRPAVIRIVRSSSIGAGMTSRSVLPSYSPISSRSRFRPESRTYRFEDSPSTRWLYCELSINTASHLAHRYSTLHDFHHAPQSRLTERPIPLALVNLPKQLPGRLHHQSDVRKVGEADTKCGLDIGGCEGGGGVGRARRCRGIGSLSSQLHPSVP